MTETFKVDDYKYKIDRLPRLTKKLHNLHTAKDLWKIYYRCLRKQQRGNIIQNCYFIARRHSNDPIININLDYTTIKDCTFAAFPSLINRFKFCWKYLRGKI